MKDIAKIFHDGMAPISPLLGGKQPELRSEFRIGFIAGLLLKADELSGMKLVVRAANCWLIRELLTQPATAL